MSSYDEKLSQQIEQYRNVAIHELPKIFHYWSHKFLGPMIEEVFEVSAFALIYARQFKQAFRASGLRTAVSLGAGDGWVEVDIAKAMRGLGETEFQIHCVELSEHLIERARERVAAEGLGQHFVFHQADLNTWRSQQRYGAFMANQSLHHMVDLEGIFDFVKDRMVSGGRFVSNDTIGRNGHMRWPEVKALVDYLWEGLPTEFKYHHQLSRLEDPRFLDWDCSNEGFEGVRAQDVLPLLRQRFTFSHFVAWGGLIDIFIERSFGHNFDPEDETHREFIDFVHRLNEAQICAGFIKPTQMFAVMTLDNCSAVKTSRGIDPALAERNVSSSIPWPRAMRAVSENS